MDFEAFPKLILLLIYSKSPKTGLFIFLKFYYKLLSLGKFCYLLLILLELRGVLLLFIKLLA